MLSRRIVVQSFAVVMGLIMSLQCGEAVAGKWVFDDMQIEGHADYDFRVEVFYWHPILGPKPLGNAGGYWYTSNGGDPQWMVYTWSLNLEIGSPNGQNDEVFGSVFRRDLLSGNGEWEHIEDIEPEWDPNL